MRTARSWFWAMTLRMALPSRSKLAIGYQAFGSMGVLRYLTSSAPRCWLQSTPLWLRIMRT